MGGVARLLCLLWMAASPSVTLTVVVENVRSDKGVVGTLVFRSAAGWPESVRSAVMRKAVPAHAGVVTLQLAGLAPGEYAVVVLHDENENMKLDKSFFGRPREGWGMSNNPKARLSAPAFERARFSAREDARLRIRLNY